MLNAVTLFPDARAAYAETRSVRWLDPETNEIREADGLPEAFRRIEPLREEVRDELEASFEALLHSQGAEEGGKS